VPRDAPRIALAGRSNVGKSSLINALCRRKVARTSAAPGKTRLANVYRVALEGGGGPGRWDVYLVDLPGYGYARGGAESAVELKAVAEAYFADRGSGLGTRGSGRERGGRRPGDLSVDSARPDAPSPEPRHAALLLVDARHPGLDADAAAANWLTALAVPYRVVATKIDKLSRSERARNLQTLEGTFGTAALPVSALSGEGLDHLWTTIATLARNP
jgi:GTP-binding protein